MKAKTFLLIAALFMPFTAYAKHPEHTRPLLLEVVGAFDQVLQCQALIKIVVYYTDIYQVYKTELEKSPENEQAADMRAKLIKDWENLELTARDLKIWLHVHRFDAQQFESMTYVTHQRKLLTQIIDNANAKSVVLNSLILINGCNSTIDKLDSVLEFEGGLITPPEPPAPQDVP